MGFGYHKPAFEGLSGGLTAYPPITFMRAGRDEDDGRNRLDLRGHWYNASGTWNIVWLSTYGENTGRGSEAGTASFA